MLLIELLLIFYGLFVYFIEGKHPLAFKLMFGGSLFLLLQTILNNKEYLTKAIELREESVFFYSTRMKGRTKALNMGIYYCDITEINVRKLPFIGVWAITVMGKTLPYERTISFCYKNHKELFRQLVLRAKEANPNVHISPELCKTIGGKNEK